MFSQTFNAELNPDTTDRTIVIEQNTNYSVQIESNWFFWFKDAPECIGGIDPVRTKATVTGYEVMLCLDTIIDEDGDIENPDNWTDARIVATATTLSEAIAASNKALDEHFALLSQQYQPKSSIY